MTQNPHFTTTDATFVNSYLLEENTKLPSLRLCEPLIEPGEYGVSLDFKKCYFHILLHKQDYGKIAFALPKESNPDENDYYIVLVMIYGLLPASFIINTMTKPLVDFIMQLGIRIAIYIDDIRLTNKVTCLAVFSMDRESY